MSFLFGRESSCKVGCERCWVVVQIQSCGLLLKFGEHFDRRVLPHTLWLGQSTTPHWNFRSLSFWFVCSLLCSLPISIFYFSMFSYHLQHKQLIQHFPRFRGKKKERDPNFALSPSWKCNKLFVKFWCFMNMFHSLYPWQGPFSSAWWCLLSLLKWPTFIFIGSSRLFMNDLQYNVHEFCWNLPFYIYFFLFSFAF